MALLKAWFNRLSIALVYDMNLTVNTLHLYYKDQPAIAACR